MKENLKLELMWEGVECFHFGHLGAETLASKLDGWHSNVESTFLLDYKGRDVSCYYDANEMLEASKINMANFLNDAWVDRFIKYSQDLLSEAEDFTKETHLRSSDVSKELIFDRTKRASLILYKTLIAFHVTQPQYTWGIESYISSLLPSLKSETISEIISLLAQSSVATLLTEEEDAWASLVSKLRSEYTSIPLSSDSIVAEVLKQHALKYGLVRAADGQSPWNDSDLFIRLTNDWHNPTLVRDRDKDAYNLDLEKREIIIRYKIPAEVVSICNNLARMSHIRLETRLRGWMPVESILTYELFPELSKHVPYSSEQLEYCRTKELFEILEYKEPLSKGELDNRRKHCVAGILKGEEVLWVGDDAEIKLKQFLPQINYQAKEIIGQTAMKGKVQGVCHIIRWSEDISANQIDEMPEGAILVAGQTRPQLMAAIKKAGAIITDEGGLLSHAAIVSRELRIPCIIGTGYATKILKSGDLVEVDADNGIVKLI